MAKRVLLVDDSPSVVQAAYDQLEERGYIIDVAYNGLEALKRLVAATPDLIIMDIEMPKMRGDEAAEQIRDNPLWALIPIIALTGRRPEFVGPRSSLFNAYLIKPFGFEEMLKKVVELIGPAEPA
jgi:two-component system, OmpR family, alkaline phosphatase synthesis response regulator PhoP